MSQETLWLAVDDHGNPEIFSSIQGEGASLGAPRTFIRLSGCNLHCKWCDTAYTWNFEGTPFSHEDDVKFVPEAERLSRSFDDVAAEVATSEPSGIVITGGEPMLQKGKLEGLITAIKNECGPVWVEIETNGSIAPPAGLIPLVNQFNVSPKLAHSGNDSAIALNEASLASYAAMPQSWFKFVIGSPEDLEEVLLLTRKFRIPHERVYLMPLGRSSDEVRTRSKWLTEECLRHGMNFTDRLHIHLYGDTRGT